MSAIATQISIGLRLHLRNRMALIYAYLFPTLFLVSFLVLYRYEAAPLLNHMGELLTITILGGACFGLPTKLVDERERGVWRRYRIAPVSPASLLGAAMIERYLLLLVAGLLQLAIAAGVGTPLPAHPLALWLAFTCVALAFIGLGLLIAAAADTVPAVQALGQCLFLPMLIVGGVAVPLALLPEWVQRLSAFMPGRFAVHALQQAITGGGAPAAAVDIAALVAFAAGALLAGTVLFRWDPHERFRTRGGGRWLALAFVPWLIVGVLTNSRDREVAPAATSAPTPVPAPAAPADTAEIAAGEFVTPAAAAAPRRESPPPAQSPATWQALRPAAVAGTFAFDRLPADEGVVTPVAPGLVAVEPEIAAQIEIVRMIFETWEPAMAADPVQRVRNLLHVAAVFDLLQHPLERVMPLLVLERLEKDVPREDLVRLLFWVATHGDEGSEAALDTLEPFGVNGRHVGLEAMRSRTAIFAMKLLGRVTGLRPAP